MAGTSFDLIVISSESDPSGEIEIISCLFKSGLEVFHLRKPDWSKEQVNNLLKKLPAAFHPKIVLHSHFELSETYDVKGIHLNEENKKRREEYSNYKIVSAAFHSLEDLTENVFPYEYVFLSPVFDSISKLGYKGQFDLTAIGEEWKRNQALPKVIALGGINEDNIQLVKQAGFSGAAVLGAIWQADDPVTAFLNINAIVDQL
jgi:thiamine-phosphate pyrophosphorylase